MRDTGNLDPFWTACFLIDQCYGGNKESWGGSLLNRLVKENLSEESIFELKYEY